jgi:hypothetical protein
MANLHLYSLRIEERFRGVPAMRQTEFYFQAPNKRLQPHCEQRPVTDLALFARIPMKPERVPVPRPLSRSESPTRRRAESRLPIVRGRVPSRAGSVAIPPSLHRRSSLDKPQPSGFDSKSTADAADGR